MSTGLIVGLGPVRLLEVRTEGGTATVIGVKEMIPRVLPVFLFPVILAGCSKEEPASAELAAIEMGDAILE